MWEEEDRMAGQAFDPKTFFLLHGKNRPLNSRHICSFGVLVLFTLFALLKTLLDVNGDMYIDPYELEAIFQAELDKVYDPNNPDVNRKASSLN